MFCDLAALISAGRSATSNEGLVGDSSHNKSAPSSAAITSSVFAIETNVAFIFFAAVKLPSKVITPE